MQNEEAATKAIEANLASAQQARRVNSRAAKNPFKPRKLQDDPNRLMQKAEITLKKALDTEKKALEIEKCREEVAKAQRLQAIAD